VLLIVNSAIFQLFHGENKLIFNDDEVRFVLDQHAELDLYSASSLKQQSADRHVAPLGIVFKKIFISLIARYQILAMT